MRHSFFRCTAIFILILSLGVGHSWADEITVYVTGKIFIGTGENAWDNATSTIKVDVRLNHPECFDCQDFKGLSNQDMTNTGYTYNGYPIYSYTLNQAGAQFRFKHYKSGTFKENYTTDWHETTNQIYQGYYSETHHWITYGRDVTFYATPEKMDGSKWKEGTHSLFANFKYGDGDSEWKRQQMTKTAYTYNGYAIYTCTMLLPYNVIKKVQFLYNDGSDHDLYVYTPSPQLTANDVDGKILLGWNGSHNWATYGRDVTIYTIPDYLFKDKETPFNESTHYPAVCIQMGTGSTWKQVNMTKTSYTYETNPIYKATILIDQNKFWEFQIKYFNKSGDSQVDLYQFNNYEPKTEYAPSYIDDKLYHGYNGESHDFFSYRYDVALDMQSGGGGSTSIIAIDGSAMPSATMPGRDGYEFDGYWTEPNGGGTQYYNSNGSSTRNWDSRTITTLYAKWTARNYTVTLEGMEADGGPINVDVKYDAVLQPLENKHTKAHYDLLGYWAADDHGMNKTKRLIDENGNWIPDVEGYTGKDGEGRPTWRYADRNISLFADWKEKKYTVDVAVSPAGVGSVTLNGSPISKVENIGYVTHSAEMTAVPANAAWVFKEWQVTSEAHLDLERYKQDKPTMKITATGNGQTLTAVFEKRYNLVGSKYEEEYTKGHMPTGGMPGWDFDNKADFTIHSYTPKGDDATVNMSYTCELEAGDYFFEIHDREKGKSLGRKNGNKIYVLNDGGSVELQGGEHQDQSIFFYPKHKGQYTFRITYMRKDDDFYYPTVTVERPHQLHMGHVHAEIDNTSATNSGDIGGTLSATIGGSPIYNDGLYNYGADIAYEASPATGYTAKWYTDNTYSSEFSEQPANSWTHSNVTDDENVYVRFTEIPTAVTLSNDGHGHVEIGGMTVSSTTVGVTTHRKLTAVPDEGYKLNSWEIVSGNDIDLSSTSTNPTTLSGLGAGAVSGQEVRANFDYRWTLKAESEGWGSAEFNIENISTNASGDVVGYVDIALPANTNLQFKMVDKQTGEYYKSGSDRVYYMTNGNSYNWDFALGREHNCGITTAGAGTYRFIWNITDKTMSVIYPNFVIYRTGDQGEDSESATHTTTSPVESYLGGTIEKAIEFRMKVRELDKWYTLCLPFVVNKVCVWDNADGAYYDIVPYYRTGGKFYTGHYIIRKPLTTTDFAIEGFEGRDRWIDPASPDVRPSKNIPYIIQWHDSYFLNKYISFFGDTNQDIPSDFNAGEAPSEDDVVNIFGNNTMHNGTVRDAYLLDKDYGPSGAWLREAIGTIRTIRPFECFILANTATTTRYRILRRGMEETDTPTALEQISNHQSPMTIRVYTITGVLIGEYNDCSFQDAAHRIATDYNEGIYILRSENESMKLLLGGK